MRMRREKEGVRREEEGCEWSHEEWGEKMSENEEEG